MMRNDLINFIKDTGKPLPSELESNKYRVLIVDDEKGVVEAVKAMLDDLGVELELETAYDGLEAGYKLGRFLPHLVILDAIMPGADGDRVVKLIRGSNDLKNIKILVFTGYPGEGQKLVKLGADNAIEKFSKESEPEPFRKEACKLLGIKYMKVLIKV